MALRGHYYDGASSTRHNVTLWREGPLLLVAGDGIERGCEISQLRISPPLGRLRCTLTFPDGALCEVEESAALDALLGKSGPARAEGLVHGWEKSLSFAAAALVLTVLLVWGFLRFGIPVVARHVAAAIPAASEATMGKETLDFLDGFILQPSALPEERQLEVRQLFAELCRNLPGATGYRLELRASKALGANALALPGGIVIATDDFITLAAHNDEIVAVLAHECAHIRQRHALRQVLQNSAAGVVIVALTGDITSITALAAGLPTALVNARYSRQFEEEADDQAIAYLLAQKIPVGRYADILRRLQAAHDEKNGGAATREKAFGDLFSTHPETEARVRRILPHQAL
ncbi:MAG TPA: peptidase M48 [Desulfuromonas sp.]|nr:peptidase M48 [Desulfuromonas sp.]